MPTKQHVTRNFAIANMVALAFPDLPRNEKEARKALGEHVLFTYVSRVWRIKPELLIDAAFAAFVDNDHECGTIARNVKLTRENALIAKNSP